MKSTLWGAAIATLCVISAGSVEAQQTSIPGTSLVPGPVISGVCMTSKDTEHSNSSVVLVAQPNADAYSAMGFQPVPCGDKFASPAKRERWRNWVCSATSVGDPQVVDSFINKFGVEAPLLCGSAELVVGEWERDGATESDFEGAQ